jgi:transposase InsO family protein
VGLSAAPHLAQARAWEHQPQTRPTPLPFGRARSSASPGASGWLALPVAWSPAIGGQGRRGPWTRRQDVLVDGRRFRTLNVLDIVTRECLAIEVDTSLPGQRVVRLLQQLICWHGVPKQIALDNGPEFTGQVLDVWAYEHNVTLDFIEPGTSSKPMQNGYMESFNGKFRGECLNVHWFRSLADARQIVEDWRQSYNTQRAVR